MRITEITTTLVSIHTPDLPFARNLPIVKVMTDEDIHGYGEAYSCGPDKATVEVIRDFASWLVGRDPRDFAGLRREMAVSSRFPAGAIISAAISGVEQACIDIAAKAAKVPAYRLLGGRCRDQVRVYTHLRADTPDRLVAKAHELRERYQFNAFKLHALPSDYAEQPWLTTLKRASARVKAVREAVGDEVDLGFEVHARLFEPVRAAELCEVLAPYHPMFVEEPLRPERPEAWTRLIAQTRVPIATGEQLYSKYQFQQLLAAGAADIVQPDVCLTGVLEAQKIATLAEANYVSVAPHNPCGPLANAVNAHLAATLPNFIILEYLPDDVTPRRDLVHAPLELRDGYLILPDTPGWGVELDEPALSRFPYQPWQRPKLHHADGAIALQ